MRFSPAQLDQPTFFELLSKLYEQKHTGLVMIHFAEGHPTAVDLPAEPVRIRLTKDKATA